MARVVFTPQLERFIACPAREVEAATVRTALDAVFAENERLRAYILDEQGRLRQHIMIFIDGAMIEDRIRLSDPLQRDSELFVLQALSGG